MLIADRYCSRHADAMGREPAERTAPDLFPTATASVSPLPKATTGSEPQRCVLPKNLRSAVKHLSDGELDLMHAAILEELKRRDRTPKSVETDLPALAPYQNGEIERSGSLTDPWSDECGAVSIQSRHNAIANCSTMRFVTGKCEEGIGSRRVRLRSPMLLKRPSGMTQAGFDGSD